MAPLQTLPEFLVSRCKSDIIDLHESLRLVEHHKTLQALQADEQCIVALPYLVSTLSNIQSVLGTKSSEPDLTSEAAAMRGQKGDVATFTAGKSTNGGSTTDTLDVSDLSASFSDDPQPRVLSLFVHRILPTDAKWAEDDDRKAILDLADPHHQSMVTSPWPQIAWLRGNLALIRSDDRAQLALAKKSLQLRLQEKLNCRVVLRNGGESLIALLFRVTRNGKACDERAIYQALIAKYPLLLSQHQPVLDHSHFTGSSSLGYVFIVSDLEFARAFASTHSPITLDSGHTLAATVELLEDPQDWRSIQCF